MSKNEFPKILSNIPEGKDLFKAESHQKIANTIINIIENQSSLINKQIIGLQGDWGTGKSNIIKIIEEEISKKDNLKDKYLHYTFDTWTHQEDLTRKSIIIELINSLRDKIDSFKSDNWTDKEAQLSQKRITKNTKHFPQVKLYYVFLVIGFVFIKFINETKKQIIGGKLYGYYDNSLNYLKNEFHINFSDAINYTYIYKLIPYLFILISVILFIKSFYKDREINNKKNKGDKSKLSFLGLVGKSFYWISGEKLETDSDETITETEPSNLRFRNFLNDIDSELILNKKTLILTIDNTDRLTNEKLKSIWSTINIFFAENNNASFLKNIWLIIPFDSKKIIESFDQNIGLGLLEKTFALTFKVPPPLISNWELFFDTCFEKAFEKVKIDEQSIEIEILKKIFHHYERNITPRKIINFINQISTYYLQNSTIKLRYFSIVILCSEKLYEGNINENIINRNEYLNTLDHLFIDDNSLELNLSKIIYGLIKDEDAEEALLLNEIEALLKGTNEFNEKITNMPSFSGYFYKYFKKHIDSNRVGEITDSYHFDIITDVLFRVKDSFLHNNQISLYTGLWEFYLQELTNNDFTSFNKTHEGIITFCTKKNSIQFIKKFVDKSPNTRSIMTSEEEISERQTKYIDFLRNLDAFLEKTNKFSFKEIELKNYVVGIKLFLENIKTKDKEFKKYKITSTNDQFKSFFSGRVNGTIDFSALTKYQEEIIILQDDFQIDFIVVFLNNLKSHKFSNIEEIETLIFFSRKLKNNNLKVSLNNFGNDSLNSFVNLLTNETNHKADFSSVYMLIFINYSNGNLLDSNEIFSQFLKKIDENQTNYLSSEFENFKEFHELINIIKISLQFNEIDNLKKLSIKLLEEKKLNLNEENFNWILQNFSLLSNKIFNDNIELLYNFINENSTNFECKIEKIDPEIINNSRKKINLKLTKLTNEYLFNNIKSNPTFFRNQNANEYKLFNKLLSLNKIDNKIYEILHQPFISLILNNWAIPKNQETNLKLVKEKLEKEKLKELIEENIDRILARSSLFLLTPEVLPYFNKFDTLRKSRALKILIDNPEHYNIELIEYVQNFGNKSFTGLLIKNLQNHHNIELINFGVSKGLIEPNPN